MLACHETDAPETGDIQLSHHAHDGSIIDRGVATHEYPLIIAVAGDRGQARHKLGKLDLGFLQEDPALLVDGDRQRLLVGVVQLPRLGAREVNRNTRCQKRCRHHEDDQQYKHHVDKRGDVDVGLRAKASGAAAPPRAAAT